MAGQNYIDVALLGVTSLNQVSNLITVEAAVPITDDVDDVERFGAVDYFNALGVTARPAPPNGDGAAEGVVLRNVGGRNGVVVGGRDARTGQVVAELGPGETALHSTGEDFDSRVFCKDQLVSIVVGDDVIVSVDRKNKAIVIAGWGHSVEVSEDNGVLLTESTGQAFLSLKDGEAWLCGSKVKLGAGPFTGVNDHAQIGTTAGCTGTVGATTASVGVLISV